MSFNGAAAVMPRIRRRWRAPASRCRCCFNGAAAVMPRILDTLSDDERALGELQWGRGCDAADTAKEQPAGLLQRLAGFNGAAAVMPRIPDLPAEEI